MIWKLEKMDKKKITANKLESMRKKQVHIDHEQEAK